jgi:hypothetical protein
MKVWNKTNILDHLDQELCPWLIDMGNVFLLYVKLKGASKKPPFNPPISPKCSGNHSSVQKKLTTALHVFVARASGSQRVCRACVHRGCLHSSQHSTQWHCLQSFPVLCPSLSSVLPWLLCCLGEEWEVRSHIWVGHNIKEWKSHWNYFGSLSNFTSIFSFWTKSHSSLLTPHASNESILIFLF